MVTKWAVGQNYYKVKNYLLKDNFRLVDTLMNHSQTLWEAYFDDGFSKVILTTKVFTKEGKLQCGEVIKIKKVDYD